MNAQTYIIGLDFNTSAREVSVVATSAKEAKQAAFDALSDDEQNNLASMETLAIEPLNA